MLPLLQLLVTFAVTLGVYRLFKLIRNELTSPIRYFPGPPSWNFLLGNFLQIFDLDQLSLHREWIEKYGRTIKYRGLLWRSRLYTADLKAINHILMNNYIYQKPEAATYNLRRVLGEGVLLTEMDVHKNQRKILNPAFGPLQIRELTAIFIEKAVQLRDTWTSEMKDGDGEAKVDALSWLSRTTLDVIGKAGFGYDFGALSEDPDHRNELAEAFATMFKVGSRLNFVALLRGVFPILRFLRADRDAEGTKASQIMFRIGRELLEERKRETVLSEKTSHLRGGDDLLSLLVRANTAKNIPENQRMSDQDVVSQIPTFIVAGHETTSTAVTWTLYSLTRYKTIQEKLREELLAVWTDNPTMDDLNSLSYLDAVVRETLRLHAPVAATLRIAKEEDILPLENPVIDRQGNTHNHIRITKGQTILIPIALINTSKEIWGEDAREFNPSRWSSVPPAASDIPGVWGNMLTFLGGPRACIGYRFSLIEMKALLFTLIRAFEFELAVPHEDIVGKSEIVTRPVLKTDPNNANQLPIVIRPVVLS
ncbi:cytochrome P450 [Macrolepiota fuliginosa MF-IS2]|uniref:Cytochrome P450 n=1 Tax=Macrolepiota fuliginosa MF-IS2 TaxID=1400762 RepID=A0A9P5XPX6_9AGAR|nr:cytochrome P450 [Macrolepiota fuliginosa MF-IS2]